MTPCFNPTGVLRALGKGVLEGNELTLDFTFKVPVKGMADKGTARTPMGFEPATGDSAMRKAAASGSGAALSSS